MSKVPNNSPVQREFVKYDKLSTPGTYDLMHELRRALKLHAFEYVHKDGSRRYAVVLNYITGDQRVHQLAETEILL